MSSVYRIGTVLSPIYIEYVLCYRDNCPDHYLGCYAFGDSCHHGPGPEDDRVPCYDHNSVGGPGPEDDRIRHLHANLCPSTRSYHTQSCGDGPIHTHECSEQLFSELPAHS